MLVIGWRWACMTLAVALITCEQVVKAQPRPNPNPSTYTPEHWFPPHLIHFNYHLKQFNHQITEHLELCSCDFSVMSEELPHRPRRRRSDETMSTIDNMPSPPYGLEDVYEFLFSI
jgi:hypothetical protein